MEMSDDTAVTTVAKGSVNGKGQQKTFLIWKKTVIEYI
jgi:hypothetical protein